MSLDHNNSVPRHDTQFRFHAQEAVSDHAFSLVMLSVLNGSPKSKYLAFQVYPFCLYD